MAVDSDTSEIVSGGGIDRSGYHAVAPRGGIHLHRQDWNKPRLKRALLIVGSVVAVLALFVGLTLWRAYNGIEREAFDPASAAQALAVIPQDVAQQLHEELTAEERARIQAELDETIEILRSEAEGIDGPLAAIAAAAAEPKPFIVPNAVSPALPDSMFDTYLLIGADASGYLADSIILILDPTDGAAPIMLSVPRDLYLPNPCTQRNSRVNAALGGCKGYASGPEMVSIMLGQFTGVAVDHFARVNFAGFAGVVDAVGGVEVCVDYPTRDLKSNLDIPAGCNQLDGGGALAWVRSRRGEQLVGESWQSIGGSDFTRQQRQQQMLFKLAGRVASFGSLGSFSAVAQSIASVLRLDSGWSFADAIGQVWANRGITSAQVSRISIPVKNFRTSGGAAVLVPEATFNAVLAKVYPAAAR